MALGHYEQKHKRHWILAFSHGSRLERAVSTVKRLPGRRVLDFGSGDGALERMLAEDSAWNGSMVAADSDSKQVLECRQRLGNLANTSFITVTELSGQPVFQTIVCLEVLEHVVECEAVLDFLNSSLAPGGHLIISVPVETGFTLMAKQIIRHRLGGDYKYTERYTLLELWSAMIPTNKHHNRPSFDNALGVPGYGHKLFNWRWLRGALGRRFTISEVFSTPNSLLPSQKWFVCRKH